MGAHVYKKIEIVGSSTVSNDDAIKNAISKAAQSIKNMDWYEVVEQRGHLADGKIAHYQVTVKIGFRLED